jgi:site-specific DNA-methyltransferase (adenine-specific)
MASHPDSGALAEQFACGYEFAAFGTTLRVHADCFEWMSSIQEASIHAIVTDPPYGVKEYDFDQLQKRSNGDGGIWRIPPSFDGNERSPLPRFTALSDEDRLRLQEFFETWGRLALRGLRPGGHLFLASNTFLSQMVFGALVRSGLEFRGEIIRLVRTLRGGDRPKNAEQEFKDICSMPRGCYEPWGLFRKPMPPRMTVAECLRTYETGGLRRKADGRPFEDVISSERTPQREREIAGHPSLKPQSFLRNIVYASLPLGRGVVLDPFMGSGSTIAAAEAIGYQSIGVERHADYFAMSREAIPKLAQLTVREDQLELMSL